MLLVDAVFRLVVVTVFGLLECAVFGLVTVTIFRFVVVIFIVVVIVFLIIVAFLPNTDLLDRFVVFVVILYSQHWYATRSGAASLRLSCVNRQGCPLAFAKGRSGVESTVTVQVAGLVPVSVVLTGHGVGLVVVGAETE